MDDEPGKNAEEIESNKESVTEATESPQGYEAKNHRRPSSKLWTPYGDQEVKGEEPPGEGAEEEELSEEELRERIEKALEKITVTDVVLDMMISLSSLAYQKMGIPHEVNEKFRDMEQAKLAIDCLDALAKVLSDTLSEDELKPLLGTLDNLKMNFAKEA